MSEHEAKEGHAEKSHAGGGGGHHAGGGHEEGHEGAPEWLISFADMVMLIMGFFVILLAMNMAKQTAGGIGGKDAMGGSDSDLMMEFVISIREAFNNPIDLNSKNVDDQAVLRYILRRGSGEADMESVPGTHRNVQAIRNGSIVNIVASVLFEDQSAVLSSGGRETLADAAARLADRRWIVEVRGHVGPFEVMHNPVRARELSYQRALAAGSALVDAGMAWDSLRLVACGDANRLVARTSDRAEDRANQRVELVVTTDMVQPDPYALPAERQ